MSGPDIFLSYNREDAARARHFAEAFQADGFEVWWDVELRSGEAYDEVTERALREAGAVVVLWSERSVVSRWVRAEATLADRAKTLVPAMIEDCERPIMFELTQTAELSHWRGDVGDRAWKAFAKDVRGFVERARAAKAPVEPEPQAAAEGGTVELPSLAILPFSNRSGEASDDAFAFGMVEDLIAALSLADNIRVISSSATRGYRDAAIDVRTIGEELGVRYVLEGNVRRIGEDLRVTSQLVDAHNGAILWTQRFDRPLSDLAALQEDLVEEVASHLGVQIQQIEVGRALAKPGDITAWEAMARGMSFSSMMTPESLPKGLDELRRATTLAPKFAPALAFRAQMAALNHWQVRDIDVVSLKREAREYADKALALDPQNPAVLGPVARTLCLIGSWKDGLRTAERAFQINPNRFEAHDAMAMACAYYKRVDEGLEHLDACIKLAPKNPQMHILLIQKAGMHFMARRYYKALQFSEQSLAFAPGFPFARKDIPIHLEKLGQREEAIEALVDFREHFPKLTLEDLDRWHQRSLLAPDVAQEMFETFATVWKAAEGSA